MFIKTLTVSQLNNYIKKTLDNDFILKNASIKGEISNLKIHTSGHIYFSLKDENGKINCIMFNSYAQKIKFIPEDGMKVIVSGRVSIYSKEGQYQLYSEEMKIDGIGELYIEFEKLKIRLEDKGLFDISHKKTIPKYVSRIGVITSPTGAAVRDIINVIKRRNKNVEIIIYPALVQGINASTQIISGIKYFDNRDDIDVIIMARGGGSIEELWSFNDEKLAAAIYDAEKPIISGIGHETDFTIADFVSDLRAPTPSAAAEVAVYDLYELVDKIENINFLLESKVKNRIDRYLVQLERLNNKINLNNPLNYISNQYSLIDYLTDKLDKIVKFEIQKDKRKLSEMNSLLSAYNPLNILNKGFAVIQDEEGNLIRFRECLKDNNKVIVNLSDGKAKMVINEIDYIN